MTDKQDSGKLVDMFTRQTSEDVQQAYKAVSDENVRTSGKYVGRLPKELAEQLRKQIEEVNFRHSQLIHMKTQFEQSWEQYLADVSVAMKQLHIDSTFFNIDRDELHISADGHTYIIHGK